MKNITSGIFLLIFSFLFQSNLIANNEVVNVKTQLTYGDWNGATTEHLPTKIKSFYYDSSNKLVRTMSALYQLGDSETTIEVEYEGQLKPETYTLYDYNDAGLLVQIRERKYKVVNNFNYGWTTDEVVETNSYNDAGQLIIKNSFYDGEFTYIWDGDTLKEETNISPQGTWNYTKKYSNFIDGTVDCPLSVFQTGKYQNYIIENDYDNQNRLIISTYYNIKEAQKDDEGKIVSGVKGDPYMQDCWSYQDDLMTCYINSYWNRSDSSFVPNRKQVFVYDENEGGIKEQVYSYNTSTKNWYVFGTPKVTISEEFSLAHSVSNLTADVVSSLPNSIKLQFDEPSGVPANIQWKVFRNGDFVGNASLIDGKMCFFDYEVPNGDWDYFVMADTINYPGNKAISNVVEMKFNTPLPPVKDIVCLESGQTIVDGNPAYAYNLTWNAPETNYKVLGYQIYLNPKSYEKNPAAHNRILVKEPRYQLWSASFNDDVNTIIVEAVYNIGYVKSEPVEFKLDVNNQISSVGRINQKTHVVYGDVMGGASASTPQKIHTYFYDNNNNVVSSIESGYLLGDDPDTEVVESKGDLVPITYNHYEFDGQGRLVKVKSKDFGMYSGYDKAWTDEYTVKESYKYDNFTGKLIEKTEPQRRYTYKWSGNKIVTECAFSNSSDTQLYQLDYSQFNNHNKAEYAFAVSKHPSITSYNRIYEFDYDENGNMTAKREYKYGDEIEKDAEGNIINANKGILYIEELWEYDNNQLMLYLKNQYSSSKKELLPYSKRVYTYTAKGVREESFTYSSMTNVQGWTKSAVVNEYTSAEYYQLTQPLNFTLTDVEGKVNTVQLTCETPEKVYLNNYEVEVYRNGVKLGNATLGDDGKWTYVDSEVQNGVWDYFVKVSSHLEGADFYTSNVIEKNFNTELTPVTNVSFPVNGINKDGKLSLQVVWDTPQSDLEIKGYNIFTDIKSFTKNPAPDNGVTMIPSDQTDYLYTWSSLIKYEKTVCVETVYNVGKIKSEYFPVTISQVPVGIEKLENNSDITIANNSLLLGKEYDRIDVYTAGGVKVSSLRRQSVVHLDGLSCGVYVLRLSSNESVKTVKFIKR